MKQADKFTKGLKLETFNNDLFGEVRLTISDNKLYVVARDVAKALGYANTSKAINDHCKGVTKRYILTKGGTQSINVIGRSDVYRLIVKSNKEESEKFETWLFEEVIPSIEDNGAYMTEETLEKALTDPDFLIQLATKLKEEQEARKKAEDERDKLIHQGKLYNATEIAKELGMSAKELNEILKENKIQFKQNGTWVLYAKYQNKGYTSIKQRTLENGRVIYDRKWTGEGRDFVIGLFNNNKLK